MLAFFFHHMYTAEIVKIDAFSAEKAWEKLEALGHKKENYMLEASN